MAWGILSPSCPDHDGGLVAWVDNEPTLLVMYEVLSDAYSPRMGRGCQKQDGDGR